MGSKTKDSLSSIYSNPLSFVAKRLPNFNEALISSASQATVNTLLDRYKLSFGDNPTASAIFRDASKLPSVSANVYYGNTLGYTDVKYDEAAIWSHTIKFACKASILVPYAFISSKYNIPQDGTYSENILTLMYPENTDAKELSAANFVLIARITNYVCEVPNRYLSIKGREKQKFEKDNPGVCEAPNHYLSIKDNIDQPEKTFWEFTAEDIGKTGREWWSEATGEAIVKTAISDQLGEVVKWLGYIGWIRDGAALIDNLIVTSMGGTTLFLPEDDIFTKGIKTFSMFGLDIRTPVVFFSTLAVDWTAKFSTETINAYLLKAPTVTCQDFTGIAIREFNEFTFSGKTETTDEL